MDASKYDAELSPFWRERFKQLDRRIDALNCVMAWLLARLSKTEHLRDDAVLRFLSRYANELEEEGIEPDMVQLFDELRQLIAHYEDF